MKAISAREAKYNFGRLIDTARAEPVNCGKARPPGGGRACGGEIRKSDRGNKYLRRETRARTR